MTDEIDPEVLEDLRAREASERDPKRKRDANYTWTQPVAIGAWKCRNGACQAFVDVTEETMERWSMCNSWLRKRGEDPLETSSVLVCEVCQLELESYRAERIRTKTNDLAACIRALKQSEKPRSEKILLERIRKLHHPDLEGLLESLDARPTKKERRL